MPLFSCLVRSVNKKTGEKTMYDLENKINFSVFPSLQGVCSYIHVWCILSMMVYVICLWMVICSYVVMCVYRHRE